MRLRPEFLLSFGKVTNLVLTKSGGPDPTSTPRGYAPGKNINISVAILGDSRRQKVGYFDQSNIRQGIKMIR
jgi:hypothetical protein